MKQKRTIKSNKALVFFTVLILYHYPIFSQTHNNTGDIYSYLYVDSIPKFQCGSNCLHKFIQQNLKWPDNTEDVCGTVLMSFVVLANGNLANIKIEKPLSPTFDAEAIRLIKSMPKWRPGKVENKAVNVKMFFPVDFYIVNG